MDESRRSHSHGRRDIDGVPIHKVGSRRFSIALTRQIWTKKRNPWCRDETSDACYDYESNFFYWVIPFNHPDELPPGVREIFDFMGTHMVDVIRTKGEWKFEESQDDYERELRARAWCQWARAQPLPPECSEDPKWCAEALERQERECRLVDEVIAHW